MSEESAETKEQLLQEIEELTARIASLERESDRERIEEAARQSEEVYRRAIENARGVPYRLIFSDTKYNFVGEGIEELIGVPADSFTFDALREMVKETIIFEPRPCDNPHQVTLEFRAGEFERFRADYRIRLESGEERWLNDCSVAIHDETTDEVIGSLGILVDITDRKRTEEMATRLGRILDDSRNEIFIFDAETKRFLLVNRGARDNLGYTMEELQSLTPVDLKPEFTEETFDQLLGPLRSGEQEVVRFTTMHSRKDGSLYPAEVYLQRTVFMSSSAFVAIIIDISQRRQAEEERMCLEAQIQHAQKLESLGVLAGGIAHDFNNLLVGILGNANLALSELLPGSPARDFLKQIDVAAQHAADLTRQMLAYSGRGKFVVQALDLSLVVEEMLHMMKVSISKKVGLRLNLDHDLPAIEADASQISQVIMNLVTNASEAIGDECGVIALSTGIRECDLDYLAGTYLNEGLSEGTFISLEVSDTGCGMSQETIDKIFDPFFTTKFTGRGLGLAAVMGIVRGHGGAMRVSSELGHGTVFTVLLPSSSRQAEDTAARTPQPLMWRGSGTVLVADDEMTVRELARRVLERAGLEVLLAEDGKQALEIFRAHADEIRVVLLDMTMPHLDGEETFGEMRGLRPDVSVILSSGYSEQEATERFEGRGLAGFLQKPYRPSRLIDAMRSVLERCEA
jgi:PAS domain S-box-containing protein